MAGWLLRLPVGNFLGADATVVVGTVIDPELSNQVRVTVVATGFGGRGRRPRGDLGTPRAEQPRRQPGEGGDLDVPSFLRT